jgi:hypothetical protein
MYYLIFHACVQRFDGMDEKILGGKLGLSRLVERLFSIAL